MFDKLRSRTGSLVGSAVLAAGLLAGPGVSVVVVEVLRVSVSGAATGQLDDGQPSLAARHENADRSE